MGIWENIVGTVKSMAGISDNYDADDEMEMEVDEPHFESKPAPRRSKIIPIGTGSSAQESIGIIIINSFSETQAITRELKARRPVIFSVDALDYAEARRVVDYVSGTIYGIDGDIKKVQEKSSIFIATPSHISIEAITKTNEKMREVVGVDVAL